MTRMLHAKGAVLILIVSPALAGWAASVALGQAPTAAPPTQSKLQASAVATPESPSANPTSSSTSTSTDGYEAERQKIWQSPEMAKAREYILGYAGRSRQFTPKHAAAYLDQLRRMSPSDMKAWLQRFQAKQAGIARSAAVAKAGRQLAIDRALSQHEAVQQSYAKLNQGQAEAALLTDGRIDQQQLVGKEMAEARNAFRDEQANLIMHSPDYSRIISPPYYTRVAAAATLPGNLPAGDPSNFIRGDVPGPEVIGGEAAAAAAQAAQLAAPPNFIPGP